MKKDSKSELLYSAFCEFAKNGFFGATTRDIAKRAGINISSILYYFGGKKGIYTAALENIVETVKAMCFDVLSRCQVVLDRGDPQEARAFLKELVQRFLLILCGENISQDMKTVFLSEYSKPTEDFNILYDGLILPVHKMMAMLLSQASEGRIDIQDGYLYTFPLFAQMFVFASRQDTICSFMEWNGYGEAEKQKLLKYMINQIDFQIDCGK